MIFVDSNIPMYLVGGAHPNKERAQRAIETAIAVNEQLVTDVEVFQEILHRYAAINRKQAMGPCFALLERIVDEIYPVEREDIDRAMSILLDTDLSARDALHAAVMLRRGVSRIMTFDRGFDRVTGIERLPGD